MEKSEKNVVANIIKIRGNKGLTKRDVAQIMGINEASYGRIENGKIALSYSHLVGIAKCFEMSVYDIISYPIKLVEKSDDENDPVEAILQIRLRRDKQDQALKLVFGEKDLEILNR